MKTKKDFLRLARRIVSGELAATMDDSPCASCAVVSKLPFVTSEGHTIKVFNDAGEWDYIERLTWPDGETIDQETIHRWAMADVAVTPWETGQAEEELIDACGYDGYTCKGCERRARLGL